MNDDLLKGVVGPKETVYLFIHEDGEIELWGSERIGCRAVCLRKEIEHIDYCDTDKGLDYSGLTLLAWERCEPKESIIDLHKHITAVYEFSGMDPERASAHAYRYLIHNYGRRSPFVLNVFSDVDVRVDAESHVDKVERRLELKEVNEAVYVSSHVVATRRREREDSLRRAKGDGIPF